MFNLRDYPSWKDEFEVDILPSFEEKQKIRMLNEYTPKEIQLKNCATVEEAWLKLDSKYANPFLVTSILIDDFVKFSPKGKTPEAKLVDLRDMLVKIEDDLTSVKSEGELSSNTWLHNKVVQDLPMYWQTKFVEEEEERVQKEGSRWKAMFKFIKDESLRIETKMAWRLEAKFCDSSGKEPSSSSSKSSSGLDMSRFPKKVQRQVNAVINNYEKRGKGGKTGNSSNKSSSNANVPKSANFDEYAAKIGKCPECKEVHKYISSGTKEWFVSGSFLACNAFKQMDVNQKAKILAKHNGCASCLSWSHQRDQCP